MKLSVVIPAKNESANIANCIHSFDSFRDEIEVIVVDNSSTDATKEIAASLGAKVLDTGPERNAQRNLGWRSAGGEWVVLLDADMIMPEAAVEEMLECVARGDGVQAYWIPEVRTGTGIRAAARNFERSFYDGTCIDALRLFHRSLLEKTGGYDENLIAGGEDWELDIRVLAAGARCAVMKNHLIHNEERLSLRKMLAKKAYYSKGVEEYRRKWAGHPSVKKQFSVRYRFFGVFTENGKWKRLLRHPVLAAVMFFDRFAVGIVYLFSRGR